MHLKGYSDEEGVRERTGRVLRKDEVKTSMLLSFRRVGRFSDGSNPPFRKARPLALALAVLLTVMLLSSNALPLLASSSATASSADAVEDQPSIIAEGMGDDLVVGSRPSNLTVTSWASHYKVLTEEYCIVVDYSTSFIEYQIKPYFTSDYIRYKRANPYYAGEGTVDEYGNALDSVSMTISSYGRDGYTVWFLESCTEFSIKQSFNIFRDYFELNVTYTPGTKNVRTTYYIGMCSSSGSLYDLMSNGIHRYIPGFPEDTPSSYGLGGWYPRYQMYAPACDLRVPSRTLGVEWGYEDTVAYLYSPLWLAGGSGSSSIMSFRYTSLNSVIPNPSAGISETFHTYVRPYKYTDGKDRGYDVGYAKWVAPRIAATWGNLNTATFPLTVMNAGTWSTSFRSWVENSQVKVATYSQNPNQIDWNYKSSQVANMDPDTPGYVPTTWQVYKSSGTPLTLSDGSVICNPVSGPYTQSGTYRWQLINNDDLMEWWTGTDGVFWDEINLWSTDNNPRNDYQIRSDFIYSGYLRLMKESHDSGYWDYIIGNSYTALLHLSIAADITVIEGYEPSSVFGVTMVKHVESTMNFVNNIPSTYKPRILVYQTYSSSDQSDIYSVLFAAAQYDFHVELSGVDSYDSQLHNLRMAEDMFKAMGCTRDSDARTVTVATLDLSQSTSITTSAGMVVMKGSGTPTITSTSPPSTFKLTNLRSSATQFNLAFTSSYLYQAGTNVQTSSPMTFTADGKGTYHGTINAEKTGEVVRNSNVQVSQHTSGSTTVSLVSRSATAAELNLASTGGTTAITLKGMQASTAFDIFVDGVEVATVTSGSDGSLSFERAYGSSDVLRVALSDGTPPDTTKPTVQSYSPSNGATGVSIGTKVTITFSENMDQASVEAAFSLTKGGVKVSGAFSWSSSKTMSFTPASALEYSTTYAIQVTTGAKDVAGNALESALGSQFSTEAYVNPDTIKPNVEYCFPGNGATDVVVSTAVTIAFSEGMDHDSVEEAFSMTEDGTAVSGTFSWTSDSTVVFRPGSTLDYSAVCAVQLTTAAEDLAGNALASAFGSQFTTESGTVPDTTRPTLLSSSPADGATGVSIGAKVTITFSEDMDQASVEAAFSLYKGSTKVPGTYSWSSKSVMTFDPLSNLDYSTTYAIQLTTAAKDLAGNALASAFGSQFTTVAYVPPPPDPDPPSSPLNLAARAGVREITLAWDPPSDDGDSEVTAYQVYRSRSASGTYSKVATLGTVLGYTDSDLADGTSYYYMVSATNEAGEGPLSSYAVATTYTIPSAPQGLMATPSLGQIRLDWTAPSFNGGAPIINYKIYRGTVSGQATLLATVGNVLNFTDGSVTNGVTYYYIVAAVTGVGTGASSNEVTARAGALPSEPRYVLGTAGDRQVLVTWQAPVSNGGLAITGYNVYRGTSASELSFLASTTELSYLDEGLSNGVTYHYHVTALNTAGEGTASSLAKAKPMTTPSAPVDVVAVGGNSEIRLTWSPPTDNGGEAIIGYVIYRSGAMGGWSFLAFVQDSMEYLDSGLANGVTMKYLVTAVNGAGEGLASNVTQAYTSSLPPSTPHSLVAVAGDSFVALSWLAPSDTGGSAIIGYKVYRGLDMSSMEPIASLGNAREFMDMGLSNGVKYWYAVSAMNGEGEGVMSAHVAATPVAPPSAPQNLTVVLEGDSALLTWSAPSIDNGSTIIGYNIFEEEGEGWALLATLNASTLGYWLQDLAPGSHNTYQVRAFNAVGEGAPTETGFDVADVPGRPTILWIKEGVRNASLAWSAPVEDGGSPISSYVVYRAEGTGTFHILAILPSTEFQLLNEGLTANTTYRYYVSAMNAMGAGEESDVAQATVLPDPDAGDGRTTTMKNWVAEYQGIIVASGTFIGLLAGGIFVAFLFFRSPQCEETIFIRYLKRKSKEKASYLLSPLVGALQRAKRKK